MKPLFVPLLLHGLLRCTSVGAFQARPRPAGLGGARTQSSLDTVARAPRLSSSLTENAKQRSNEYSWRTWKTFICSMKSNGEEGASSSFPELKRIPSDMEGVAIPFVDLVGNDFIECYADSVAEVGGVEYTIGVPCDYSVALCYFDEEDQLVPVELDDDLMDDIFPIAESIVDDEYGEELSLQRTPQTLTLVGELDDDEDEEEEEEEEDDDEDDEDDTEDDEEEVEVLLSFEHRGKEFNLVRLIDPILLVGKADPKTPANRILLTPSESEAIMPLLEEAFVDFHDVDTVPEYDIIDEDDELRP